MKSLLVIATLFMASVSANLSVQSRTVEGHILRSSAIPAISIKFDKAFKYVGTQKFVLYDVANAEQFFFVDANGQGSIKRMYWVQFEGYLPNNTHSYDYEVKKTVKALGLNFIADAYARNIKSNHGRADSDGNRARSFLASKGYKLASDEVLSQRLVYLVDEAKRNELMIIYLEDLSALGVSSADLSPNGKAANRWEGISKALLDRALSGMQLAR